MTTLCSEASCPISTRIKRRDINVTSIEQQQNEQQFSATVDSQTPSIICVFHVGPEVIVIQAVGRLHQKS